MIKWSEEEISRLLMLRQSCGSVREILDHLPGRTYKAVSAQLHIRGLSYPMPSGEEWTDDKVSTLKLMWAAGESTSRIGKAIDMTKNAVIGKAHRLGLSKRASPIKRRNNIIEVEFGGCQWILNDPKDGAEYCGKPRVRYGPDHAGPRPPYCAEHLSCAYRERKPRDQKRPSTGDKMFGKAI